MMSRMMLRVCSSLKLSMSKNHGHSFGRNYSQSTIILQSRTTQSFPLQAEASKEAPEIIGYNRILHRLANIILNITEKQPTKILHVFPSTGMIHYLGSENHSFDITGLANHSNQSTSPEAKPVITNNSNKKSSSGYSHLDYLPQLSNMENVPFYTSNAFQLIAHCAPLQVSSTSMTTLADPSDAPSEGKKKKTASSSSSSVSITGSHQSFDDITLVSPLGLQLSELIRLLNSRGFLILGYPEGLWNTLGYTQLLTEMSSWGESEEFIGELLTIQKIFVPIDELTTATVTGKSSSTSADDDSSNTEVSSVPPPEDELLVFQNEVIAVSGRDDVTSPPIVKYVIAVFRKK